MTTCSKNGIKKEGESCSLNNNCTYPDCLEKNFTEKDMIDFAEWIVNQDWDETELNFPNNSKTTKELLQKFLNSKQ